MKVPRTHLQIDPRLCGRPDELGDDFARVTLEVVPEMAADDRGLMHGGFAFGLADYAAMLAVNEPTVVLASAQARFLQPVTVGERLVAEARVEKREGKKRSVRAVVRRNETVVLEVDLLCVVPERHVLDRGDAR